MSYSVCLNCETPVRQYEKYCNSCAKTHRQDVMFWKTHDYSFYEEPKKTQELLADRSLNINWKVDKDKRGNKHE